MASELNGYELSRDFFDFCFENPEKITPNHIALYFFIIEHCNRLGWKEKFGLPMQMAMDAIGIKNYRTYSKAFNDLVDFGFVKLIEKSKNQYSANVVALVKNTKAKSKALSKALQKHSQKHSQKQVRGIVCIDKPNNLEPITRETQFEELHTHTSSEINFYNKFLEWEKNNSPRVRKMKEPITIQEFLKLKKDLGVETLQKLMIVMQNRGDLLRKYVSANLTLRNWANNQYSESNKSEQNGNNNTAAKLQEEKSRAILNN